MHIAVDGILNVNLGVIGEEVKIGSSSSWETQAAAICNQMRVDGRRQVAGFLGSAGDSQVKNNDGGTAAQHHDRLTKKKLGMEKDKKKTRESERARPKHKKK